MNDTNAANLNDSGQSATTNAIADAGEETCGALELEYPAARGLYREVFGRYDPEVSDLLVDTREVRMLVELEFNLCRMLCMLAELPVEDAVLSRVEDCRAEVEAVLWSTCEALAKDWLDQESGSEWAGVGWVSGSELLD